VIGAVAARYAPASTAAGLFGLGVSMASYVLLYGIARAMGLKIGHAKAEAEAGLK
jgi:hypothetical protein